MLPRLLRALALLLLLLSPVAAQAQGLTTAPDRTITLRDALQIALERNVNLRRAENVVRQQEVNVASERASFLPDLGFNTSGSYNIGRSIVENRVVDQSSQSVNMGVSSGVNLFNGFGDVASLARARALLNSTTLDLERSQQVVVFNVATSFLTVLARREQIRIQREALAQQRQQLARVEALTEAGARPRADLFQQQAEVAQAELDSVNAESAAQVAESQLIEILQLEPFGNYAFVIPDLPELGSDAFIPQRYEERSLIEQAFAQRPDLRAQEFDVRAAEEGIRVARSTAYPRLNMSVGYNSGFNSAIDRPFFDQLDQRRGGSLTLALGVPIFDRFATRHNVQRAQVQLDNTRLELEGLRQSVATQVRQAYLDYLTAQKQVEVTAVQVAAAEQSLLAAQERYNVGAATLVEVTQAQTVLTRAQSAQVQARYTFLFQEQLIEYYLGVLDPRSVVFD